MGQTYSITRFWRIENFSLVGPHEVVESPSFSVCPEGLKESGRQYYLTLDTEHPSERVRLTLKSRCGCRKEIRFSFKFAFSAYVCGGTTYDEFHTGGVMDPEIRNGVGLYRTRSFLLQRKTSRLLGDSLSFRVVISSNYLAHSPLAQQYAVTRMPEAKLTFSWEICDLSAGESDASIPSPPLHFRLRRHPDSEKNKFEVTVTYRKAKWIDIPCAVYLMEGPEAKSHVARFSVSQEPLSSGSYPKGSFVISNDLYESKVRETAGSSGKFTLIFEFRIRDGQAVSEGFSKINIVSESQKIPNLFLKSSRSFPVVREEARPAGAKTEGAFYQGDCIPGNESGEKAEKIETVRSSVDPGELHDLRSLYSDPVFSDFTLSADGRSFPVHRNILSARSVVFRAMFEADMREKREYYSEVTDVDPDTLDLMLRFVYSGDFVDPDVESAAKLFAAAVKYQIWPLRSKCVQFLASSLSVENVCRVLALADGHSDASLTMHAMNFVFRNADRVFRSDEWRGLMAENPQRAGSIMHKKLLFAPYTA